MQSVTPVFLQNLYDPLIPIARGEAHSINMIQGQSSRHRVFKGRQQVRSLEALREERAFLEEEIRQLRAAAQVYSDLVQRLSARATSTPSTMALAWGSHPAATSPIS